MRTPLGQGKTIPRSSESMFIRRHSLPFLSLIALLLSAGAAPILGAEPVPGTIVTVAGGGSLSPKAADGGPASKAHLNSPLGLAVDAAGNLYIADPSWVQKVSPQGIITTVGGTGEMSLSGDEGPSTQAAICFPSSLAFDSRGNLFIADVCNNRIRKIDPSGIITTVAGSGGTGYGRGSFDGDGGPATEASLNGPIHITVDQNGDLYINDAFNQRFRKVDAATGSISTVAGGGKQRGSAADGHLATDAELLIKSAASDEFGGGLVILGDGSFLFSEFEGARVRKVDPRGILTTVAGNGKKGFAGDGGLATQAILSRPLDLTMDSAGSLYIADYDAGRVRKVDPTSGVITTAAKGLSGPTGMAIDADGNLYVTESKGGRVKKVIGVAAPGLIAGKPFPPRPGDLNADGKITLTDATLALRLVVGLWSATEAQAKTADFDSSGKVDLADVLQILRAAIGLT